MLSDRSIRRDGPDSISNRLIQKIRKLASETNREKLNIIIREKLARNDKPFTLLANNCLAGYFYHDEGKQFTSPTINLAFDGEDYIRFLEDLPRYVYGEMKFIQTEEVRYPVAHIDDVEIRFVHYRTPEEAELIWRRRAARIVWDNLFIVATDHDGMKRPDLLKRFDCLPYKNKIMFVSEEYPEYDWAILVPQFKGRHQVKVMTALANMQGERYYETCFDIANWIATSCREDGSEKGSLSNESTCSE